MKKIIIAVTELYKKDTEIKIFENEKEVVLFLEKTFNIEIHDNILPRRLLIFKEGREVLIKIESTEIELPVAETTLDVIGGQLKASTFSEDNYSGISIDFCPDPEMDGGPTTLALVEQINDSLRLSSWTELYNMEPDIYSFVYDTYMMRQVAYHIYKNARNSENVKSFREFIDSTYKDPFSMKRILPKKLYNMYLQTRPFGGNCYDED